ncbi:DgyrCDS8763 [Dimorphilus gyrociliatus]|uniref:DgyrCDS8763 n=1 Tax=Dimorphilus gyrociliatus TaxID=2664684 RepID=A0A7I8VWL3_9ANNE|nr:DgyrCDS8763 [Dimorphilus gyrociliatus]
MRPEALLYLDNQLRINRSQDDPWTIDADPGKTPGQISMETEFNFTWSEKVRMRCEFHIKEISYKKSVEKYIYILHPVSTVTVSPDKSSYLINDKIKCEANGYPLPTMSWKGIESGDKRDINGDELEITEKMLGNNKWECKACHYYNSKENCVTKTKSFKVIKSTSDANRNVFNFSVVTVILAFLNYL